jgi:sugar lactone lactonase YvrE
MVVYRDGRRHGAGCPVIARRARRAEAISRLEIASSSSPPRNDKNTAREDMMYRWLAATLAVASAPMLTQAVMAQDAPPQIAYESVPDFLKLPPDVHLGEAAGVAVNSKGHVFVYSRGGSSVGPAFANTASQLFEFGPDGKFIREIGKNLYAWSFAHTVRIDKDDNIWATDKGSDMVIKFNPQGRVVMVFGRKPEASDHDARPYEPVQKPRPQIDGRFRQPTDVTWDTAGNIFISDGYVNSRVAKYDKDGNWVKSWGERGTAPGQFNTVHSIASDAQGQIYVADRFNRRIQVFDPDGNLKRIMQIDVPFDEKTARMAIGDKPDLTDYKTKGGTFTPGAPWALCITPGPNQVLYASDAYPGRVYKLSLDGKVLGVLGESGKQLKQFGWIHEIACPNENTLFVAEILNWRVQKLLLKPTPAQKSAAH